VPIPKILDVVEFEGSVESLGKAQKVPWLFTHAGHLRNDSSEGETALRERRSKCQPVRSRLASMSDKPKEKVTRAEFEAMENLLRKDTTKHMAPDANGQQREMTAEEREAAIKKMLGGYEIID
jgi:hypothetical protein